MHLTVGDIIFYDSIKRKKMRFFMENNLTKFLNIIIISDILLSFIISLFLLYNKCIEDDDYNRYYTIFEYMGFNITVLSLTYILTICSLHKKDIYDFISNDDIYLDEEKIILYLKSKYGCFYYLDGNYISNLLLLNIFFIVMYILNIENIYSHNICDLVYNIFSINVYIMLLHHGCKIVSIIYTKCKCDT